MGFRPLAPKASVSTNFTTPAGHTIHTLGSTTSNRRRSYLWTSGPSGKLNSRVESYKPLSAFKPMKHFHIHHPNRHLPECKTTKATVVLLLVFSAVIALVITVGGWERLAGVKAATLFYIGLYLLAAFYVARWKRGILPIAAALATLLAIFAFISSAQWFDRDQPGFSDPAIPAGLLGVLTVLLAVVQLALVAFSLRGFKQDWHVEEELPENRKGPAGHDLSAAKH